MDGGLSHIKCGKSNFIFVFSNNNIDKKCLWKVSILYCGPEIDVSVWKINKINWIVILLVFTVSLYFYFLFFIYIYNILPKNEKKILYIYPSTSIPRV